MSSIGQVACGAGAGAVTVTSCVKVEAEIEWVETVVVETDVVETDVDVTGVVETDVAGTGVVEVELVEGDADETGGFGAAQPLLQFWLSEWRVIGVQPGSPLSGFE